MVVLVVVVEVAVAVPDAVGVAVVSGNVAVTMR